MKNGVAPVDLQPELTEPRVRDGELLLLDVSLELLDRLETRFSEMDSSGDGRLTVEVGF